MKKILLLLLLAFSFSACEKDDICDATTPTTPRLVIDFYDNFNPTVKKNVENLKIIGDDLTTGIVFNPTSTGELKYLINSSSIKIPLRTDQDVVKYKFIYNSGNTIPGLINEDVLEINYTRKDVFISRACGLKTLFLLNSQNGFNLILDSNNWIKEIVKQKLSIENENEVHVKIFI
jgi:Family of unknown function (DUF6452)